MKLFALVGIIVVAIALVALFWLIATNQFDKFVDWFSTKTGLGGDDAESEIK